MPPDIDIDPFGIGDLLMLRRWSWRELAEPVVCAGQLRRAHLRRTGSYEPRGERVSRYRGQTQIRETR